MVGLVMLVLVAITSVGAYALGTRRLCLKPGDLGRAAGRALDCVGLGVLFLLTNLVLGVTAILAIRALTGQFLSVYLVRDDMLVLVSGLQGLLFSHWWQRSR
jgi:hypothetical protein